MMFSRNMLQNGYLCSRNRKVFYEYTVHIAQWIKNPILDIIFRFPKLEGYDKETFKGMSFLLHFFVLVFLSSHVEQVAVPKPHFI